MPDRVDAKAVLALNVYEAVREHMEWCHACLRFTSDGHSETCLAGALQQTLADLDIATGALADIGVSKDMTLKVAKAKANRVHALLTKAVTDAD